MMKMKQIAIAMVALSAISMAQVSAGECVLPAGALARQVPVATFKRSTFMMQQSPLVAMSNSYEPGVVDDASCYPFNCYPGGGTADDPYVLNVTAVVSPEAMAQFGAKALEAMAIRGMDKLNQTFMNSQISHIRAEFVQLQVVDDDLYAFGEKANLQADIVGYSNCLECRERRNFAGGDIFWLFHPYPQEMGTFGLSGIGAEGAVINLSAVTDVNGDPSKTIVHETGHQLGGGHQVESLISVGLYEYSHAISCQQDDGSRKHSIVSASEHSNAVYQFSSPSMSCGAAGETENARTVSEYAPYSASYNRIADVSGSVSLSAPEQVAEGGAVEITLSRSGDISNRASVGLWIEGAAVDNGLYSGDEYRFVEFDAGQDSVELTLATQADGRYQEAAISLELRLAYPAGLALHQGESDVTVALTNVDQPSLGKVSLSSSEYSVSEGAALTVQLNRTDGTDGQLSVQVTTAMGTASTKAVVALNQTVVFADGETSKVISLTTNHISDHYEDGTVILRLSGKAVGTEQATVTIHNVDTKPKPVGGSSGGAMGLDWRNALALFVLLAFRRTRK